MLANLPEPDATKPAPVGIAAFVLFVLVAASDWLDGYLARKYGQVTTIGRILDPFVDKVAVCGAYMMLLRVASGRPLIEAWMVVVIVAREFFVNDSRGYFESKGVSFGAEAPGKIKMLAPVHERQPPPPRSSRSRTRFGVLRQVNVALLWLVLAATVPPASSTCARASC